MRNKKATQYCYSEEERDAAMNKLAKGCEVTRFKGLGEISPSEFKDFIGKGMRLTGVTLEEQHHVPEVLKFYMGKNTPQRRSYIIDNLVVDETS